MAEVTDYAGTAYLRTVMSRLYFRLVQVKSLRKSNEREAAKGEMTMTPGVMSQSPLIGVSYRISVKVTEVTKVAEVSACHTSNTQVAVPL